MDQQWICNDVIFSAYSKGKFPHLFDGKMRFNVVLRLKITTMGKAQDAKKEGKKEATKTLKEKRAEKKAKKEAKKRG